MTYSIVARDPDTGELGVAVQTRWFNVGAIVGWLEPGVGAVATQSFVNVAHGPNGLALLRAGRSADAALAELIAGDDDEAVRQVGIVDATGGVAAHTGSRCVRYSGHRTSANVTAQANMMERATVWPAMVDAYEAASGDLADRLVAALLAAETEGGDVRGRQSAALLVSSGKPEAKPWDRRFDVRVEDSRDPLAELGRLLRIARAYEAMSDAEDQLATNPEAAFRGYERAAELAPEDDQIVLWSAVALAHAGRMDEARERVRAATAIERRAPDHLRRFAEAGHLPGAEKILDDLLRPA